jgi:methylmalonyl-CoA mutase N-terminal domain/subunit
MESDANELIHEIDDLGGVVQGIHKGYFRRSIAEASYRFGQEMEAGDRIIVGVNAYPDGNEDNQVELLQIPHSVETIQCERLETFLQERDDDAAMAALDTIRQTARADENVMQSLVDASLARCTLGEMVQAMADIFGRYGGGPEW